MATVQRMLDCVHPKRLSSGSGSGSHPGPGPGPGPDPGLGPGPGPDLGPGYRSVSGSRSRYKPRLGGKTYKKTVDDHAQVRVRLVLRLAVRVTSLWARMSYHGICDCQERDGAGLGTPHVPRCHGEGGRNQACHQVRHMLPTPGYKQCQA